MKNLLPFFVLLLLTISLNASLTYVSNQTATYKVGAQTVASVQLLNTLIYPNGVSTLGRDSIDGTPGCGPDLKTAKVCLAITPSVTRTLNATSRITAKVYNSLKGTVGGSGITIYEARNTTYKNAIISKAPTGQLDTNGTGIMTSFISGYFNNTIERTDWYPLDLNGYTIQSGKKYVIGLDYIRTDTSDVADLVPGIFTDDATAWAYWNSSWPINRNCTVNASTADNITFLARCTFTGLNSTTINQTSCTDPRFLVTGVDTVPRPYILSSNFSTYCGIGNATYFIPVNGSRGTTINIEGYFGNTGAASGENGPAVCSLMNISNMYIANFDENTTARDRCGVHNLTRSNTGCTVQNTKGFYPGFTYNLTGNCNWNKTVGTGLSGVCNGNMACYEYALIHLNGAAYSSQGPWQIGSPNLNYRVVYFQTAAQTTDNYASVNNAFAWAPDSNIGWNSIMDNYDQTNMYFSVANLSINKTGSATASPAPTTNNSFISIGNSGGVIAYFTAYAQMILYGTSNYSRSLAVGQINQTFVITNAIVLPVSTETLTFTNSTVSHSFFVNASSTRSPGLTNYTLKTSAGTCVQVSNQTTSGASWVYSNCTGPALVQATIQYNYTLSDGSTFNVSGNNTYPNQAPSISSISPNGVGINQTCSPNVSISVSDGDGDVPNIFFYESTDNSTWVSIGNNNSQTWATGFTSNLTNGTTVQFKAYANDTFNLSSNLTSLNNTYLAISFFESHIASQFGTETYGYNLSLNVSSCLIVDAKVGTFGANNSATKTATANGFNFTVNIGAPNVQTLTQYNGTWYINTSIPQNFTSQANNINVSPEGFFICNATINTPSILYVFQDSFTSAPVNASLVGSINWGPYLSNITGTNQTLSICITPPTFNKSANITETVTATGYLASALTRPAVNYSSAPTTYIVNLVNSSFGGYYTFQTINSYSAPISGAVISITKVSTNTLVSTSTTDITGDVFVPLQQFQIYTVNVSATGYQNVSFTFTAGSQTLIQIQLQTTNFNVTIPNFQNVFHDVQYSISPDNRTQFSPFTINYTVNSANGSLLGYGYTVTYINGSNSSVLCTGIGNASNGGSFACNANFFGTYLLNPWFMERGYANFTPYPYIFMYGNRSGLALGAQTIQTGSVISGWAWFFLALVCAMLAAGFVGGIALQFGAPIEGSGIAALLVLAAFTYVWPTAPVVNLVGSIWLDMTHITAILTLVVAAAFYLKQYGA